jgi:hypothetical protein
MSEPTVKIYLLIPNDKMGYKDVLVWADDENTAREAANIAFPDNFQRNYAKVNKSKQTYPPQDTYYNNISKVKCRELSQDEYCIKGILKDTLKLSVGKKTLILGKNRGECIE